MIANKDRSSDGNEASFTDSTVAKTASCPFLSQFFEPYSRFSYLFLLDLKYVIFSRSYYVSLIILCKAQNYIAGRWSLYDRTNFGLLCLWRSCLYWPLFLEQRRVNHAFRLLRSRLFSRNVEMCKFCGLQEFHVYAEAESLSNSVVVHVKGLGFQGSIREEAASSPPCL